MIDRTRLLFGVPVLALLLGLVYVFALRDGDGDPALAARLIEPAAGIEVGLSQGKVAPDFEIATSDGRRVKLSDLRGSPVVINFWATWCGSCASEMPRLREIQEDLGEGSFEVVAVNAGETGERVTEFIDFLDAPPFIFGLDPGLVLADAYGVYGLPYSVFIDAEGVVRATYSGEGQRQILEVLTNAAIAAADAADPPPEIRLLTTIERQRAVLVSDDGDDRLIFKSRTLRCDLSYCASVAVRSLESSAGIRSVDYDANGDSPTLTVSFDPGLVGRDAVVEIVVRALNAHPDPLYAGEVELAATTTQ